MDPSKSQQQGYIPFPSTIGIKPSIPFTPKEDDLPPGLQIENSELPPGLSNPTKKGSSLLERIKKREEQKVNLGGTSRGIVGSREFLTENPEQRQQEKFTDRGELPPGLSNPKRESLAERLEKKHREKQMERMKEKESSIMTPFEKTAPQATTEPGNLPNLSSLGFQKHNIDPGGEESKGNFSTPESAFESLKQHMINSITLMNEVNSKIDPKFEPVGTEVIVNKIKQFECNYVYDKHVIGFGKGGSKQEAKTKAAEETILAILKGEAFPVPKKILISSIQKKVNTIQKAQEVPSEEKDNQNPEDKKRDILYELNLMCQDNFIEPVWEVSDFKNSSGEYEATLTFKEISTTGKGRKKIEAKREAAHALLTLIKDTKELADKFFKKPKNKQATKTQLPVEDFFKIVAQKKFADAPVAVWNQGARESVKNLEEYLIEVEKKHRLDETILQIHLSLYNETAKLLSKIFESFADEKNEFSEYIANCRFIPIGSLALDCLSQLDHSMDILLVIEKRPEAKKIPSETLLKAMKEKFDLIDQGLPEGEGLKADVKKIDGVLKMEIQPISNSDLRLSISVNESPVNADNLAIQHVILIYSLIKPEKLIQFKRLMLLMRIWRLNREIEFIAVEVLDALLLNEFMNNKAESCGGYIKNILMILMSDEICRSILRKFGEQYLRLYEKIPSKPRYKIVDFSTQSLAALSKNSKKDFEKSYFK